MLKIRVKALAILWSITGLASLNYAATITFSAPLSGANENPAVVTPGTGFTTVSLDTVTQLLTIDLTFSGLTSATTAAHIHCCTAAGGNAGVATLLPAFPNFPLGVMSGTDHEVLDLTLASSYNPSFITANGGKVSSAEMAFVTGFENDMTYLNIHTQNNPGGEIRAILAPEPTSATLFGFALAGFWMAWRMAGRVSKKITCKQIGLRMQLARYL